MSENSPSADMLAQQLADLPDGLLSPKLLTALAVNIGRASEALSTDMRKTTFELIADAVKSGSADALQTASEAIALALEFSKSLTAAKAAVATQTFWQSKEVSGKLLEVSQKDIFTVIKTPNPKLVLYMAPTGTGKTLVVHAAKLNYRAHVVVWSSAGHRSRCAALVRHLHHGHVGCSRCAARNAVDPVPNQQ